MTDISKCSGQGCPKAETCWRALAPKGYAQSWFAAPPVNDNGTCHYYWPVPKENDRTQKRTDA